MTIAQRLYLGFGLILALFLMTTLIGVVKVGQVDTVLTRVNVTASEELAQLASRLQESVKRFKV